VSEILICFFRNISTQYKKLDSYSHYDFVAFFNVWQNFHQ